MKLKKIISLVLVLSIAIFPISCAKEETVNEESDFEASVKILSETMNIDREDAIDVLELVCSFGLDARIDNISVSVDSEEKTYYKIWFGLNLLSVYMENGEVAKIVKYGSTVFPKPEDKDEFPDDNILIYHLTSPVKAGDSATVGMIGLPNTEYQIIVKYASGASKAEGLEPKYSDAEGRVFWTWKVSSNVKPGEYSIEIRSQYTSTKTQFTVE